MASSLGSGGSAAILGGAMTRMHGPVLFLLLMVLLGFSRLITSAQSDALVEREARVRALMVDLLAASLEAVARDRPHPGLREPFLSRFPTLQARPELGTESISYADDGDYMYGLAATRTTGTDAAGSIHGFVLRAWPQDFGDTGDLEFQASDDGQLWEGSNSTGRSGTGFGFPPDFPQRDMDRRDAGWKPLVEPGEAHR
jgi:hypothetical protein